MRGIRSYIDDYFKRNPTQVPAAFVVFAIVSAISLATLAVQFDLHLRDDTTIMLAAIIATTVSLPAGYVQYKREIYIEAQKEALRDLAQTDALTGAMNRRSFQTAVRKEQARMQRTGDRAALILFDLDWFKKINDTYGHEAGDKVLRAVASVARAELRNPLDYLARWGGEEFAIYLDGVSQDQAERTAERLRHAISSVCLSGLNEELSVTASFGICELTASSDLDDAFRRADRALYAAKRTGRNKTVSLSGSAKIELADGCAA